MLRDYCNRFPRGLIEDRIQSLNNGVSEFSSMLVYSPYGTGKSSTMKYFTCNINFTRSTPDKHVKVCYWNLMGLINELDSLFFSPTAENVVVNRKAIVVKNLYRALMDSGLVPNLQIEERPSEETLYNLLNKDKKLRILFALDNIEKILLPEYRWVLDYFKSIRGMYKGRVELILTCSNYSTVTELRKELLNAQSHIQVLFKMTYSASGFYRFKMRPSTAIYHLKKILNPGFGKKFDYIDKYAGGYPPYIKAMLYFKEERSLEELVQSSEMQLASQRFLSSMSERQYAFLLGAVRTPKMLGNNLKDLPEEIAMLFKMEIVVQDDDSLKLFSPVLFHHLKAQLPR